MSRLNKRQFWRLLGMRQGLENANRDFVVVIGGKVKEVIFPSHDLGPGSIDIE